MTLMCPVRSCEYLSKTRFKHKKRDVINTALRTICNLKLVNRSKNNQNSDINMTKDAFY